MNTARNADESEVARFNDLAHRWWDPQGEMRFLHRMNPPRLAFVAAHAQLAGARVLDVGCGAGILSEALAAAGAEVTGIDLAAESLAVARLHQLEAGVARLQYRHATAEELALECPGHFDSVTCMEMLEHVPDPASVVRACATLVRPGGTVFFSTINRNPKSWALAVGAAEYLLGILPRGTHDHARFIRPAELARAARAAGLELRALGGIVPDLAGRSFRLDPDVSVNYVACFARTRA